MSKKMKDDLKKNGRRPKTKMEDDQKKMEDELKKMEDDIKKNGRRHKKIKNGRQPQNKQ